MQGQKNEFLSFIKGYGFGRAPQIKALIETLNDPERSDTVTPLGGKDLDWDFYKKERTDSHFSESMPSVLILNNTNNTSIIESDESAPLYFQFIRAPDFPLKDSIPGSFLCMGIQPELVLNISGSVRLYKPSIDVALLKSLKMIDCIRKVILDQKTNLELIKIGSKSWKGLKPFIGSPFFATFRVLHPKFSGIEIDALIAITNGPSAISAINSNLRFSVTSLEYISQLQPKYEDPFDNDEEP